MRRFLALLATAILGSVSVLIASPAVNAAPSWAYFGNLQKNDRTLIYQSPYTIYDCWNTSTKSVLKVKKSGRWQTVATSKVSRNRGVCKDSSWLHKYDWTVDVLAPTNGDGVRKLSLAIVQGNAWYYATPLEVLPDSAAPSAGTSTNNRAPSEPTYVAADAGTRSQLGISWQAPSITGTSPVSYSVTLNGNKVATGLTATSYIATGLTDSTKYRIEVSASNAAGSGSPTVIEVTTAARPLTAAEIEAAAHPGQRKVVVSISAPGAVVGNVSNATGGTDDFSSSVNPSWTMWITPSGRVNVSFFRDYSAYPPGQAPTGTMSCTITSNGALLQQSSGDYIFGVTTCSAAIR